MNDSLWAICKFRFSGPYLFLDYSASTGEKGGPYPVFNTERPLTQVEGPIRRLLYRALTLKPGDPDPVAVYYSLPRGLEIDEFTKGFGTHMQEFEGPIQFVYLARGRTLPRSPLRLPLSILISPEWEHLLAPFRAQSWMQDPIVAQFGLRTQTLLGDLELTLRTGNYAILVTGEEPEVASMLRRLPEPERPRLIIIVSESPEEPRLRIPGAAILRLSEPDPDLVNDFLHGIVHDQPLHHALFSARESQSRPFLIADPVSNQSLRLTRVLTGIKRHADRLQAVYGGLSRKAETSDELRGSRMFSAFDQALRIRSLSALSFQHEWTGLQPIAEGILNLKSVTENAPLSQPSAEPGPRHLDASLSRIETAPALTPMKRNESLLGGAAYELRVHIGNRFPESLVVGEVAGIDAIVGPPDDESGHQLEISVQGKDFRVLSSPTQPLLLPRSGSTDLVYFQVRAPGRYGNAQLRITVHHRNHLVQSFLLSAKVAESETAGGELQVRQEFARSEEFTNLDLLQQRDFFIGFNQGQTTHELMVKADQVSTELNLSATAYDQAVKDLRQALCDAIIIPNLKLARTYAKVAPGNPPSADASNAFRSLAKLGQAVYRAMFSGLRGSARKSLVRLQASVRDKIQIVRFDARAAFPWTLLYDWDLPDDRYTPSPVCLGYDAGGATCTHGPSGNKVYCVRGFWGVRHLVEELLEQQRNAGQTIPKPSSDIIRIAASTALAQAAALQTTLNASCGAGVLASGPSQEDKLLDILWQDPPVRPAVLIVLGHLEIKQITGEPDTPRVELQPSSEWFTLKHFLDRATKAADEWDDPRTIVIFAPCDSAVTDADTLNDFVTALNTAGAGAIIGMQSLVAGSQATDFAGQLTKRLWAYDSLGEAMHKVRSETVMSGDPGGFLLQSFGDIDLKLQ
jgi:hypothetical protein